MKLTEVVKVRFSEMQLAKIKEAASKNEWSVSNCIRVIVMRCLNGKGKR